jgi:hypothetical protein
MGLHSFLQLKTGIGDWKRADTYINTGNYN